MEGNEVEKLYYKSDSFGWCFDKCEHREGVSIGSCVCQSCKHNNGFSIEQRWIKCSKCTPTTSETSLKK